MNFDAVPLPQLALFYREYLRTRDSDQFVRKIGEKYTQSTLLRLSTSEHVDVKRGVILALTFLGDYDVNPVFGRLLHDPDRLVRLLAENGIKNLWPRAGNEEQRQQLRLVMRLIASDYPGEAVPYANILIAEAPDFAEAWNQRGIAFFSLKRFSEAIADAAHTLELNPYHFGAALGMGHAYMQMQQWNDALDAFETALQINPGLQNAKEMRRKLEVVSGG